MDWLMGYLLILSVIGAVVVCYDKYAAKHRKRHRVPENLLFTLAILGGCAGVYGAMLIIRHKTQHKRFMLGLPAILLLQLTALRWLLRTV